jgi:DNA replication protein DnaC
VQAMEAIKRPPAGKIQQPKRGFEVTPEMQAYWKGLVQDEVRHGLIKTAPEPVCPTCLGMKAITLDLPVDHEDFGKSFPCPACTSHKQEQARTAAMFGGDVLDHYRDLSFATFEALPDLEGKDQALHYCKMLADQGCVSTDAKRFPGLVLWGEYGMGKTGLASSALHAMAVARDKSVLFVKYAPLMADIQDTYGKKTGRSANDIANAVARIPVLLIDDVGDPDFTGMETQDKKRWLLKIIDHRHSRDMNTIITTNLNGEQFLRQFGERITQRVYEMCFWVEVKGINLRFGE